MQEEEEEPAALSLASPAKHIISPKPSFASPRSATAAGGDVEMDLTTTTEGERLGNFEIFEEDDDDAADVMEARGIKGSFRGMLNMASPSKKPPKGMQLFSLVHIEHYHVKAAYASP